MAFSQIEQTLEHGEMAAYNIDWAVGWGAPSHKVDTMLVQALMHVFYYELKGEAQFKSGVRIHMQPPPGRTSIAIDGILGPGTRAHIDQFQYDLCRFGLLNRVDHRIDPMRETVATLSTITRETYTLSQLNQMCRGTDVTNGTNYTELPPRQDMPLELRAALLTVKTVANQYRTGTPPIVVPEAGGF